MGRTNTPVTLELAQTQSLPNETIPAKVKVRDTVMNEVSNAQVSLVLNSGGKTNLTVRAQYDATSHSYLAEVRAPSAGTFTVTAMAERAGVRLGDDRQCL